MTKSTETAIRAVAATDGTITPEQLRAGLAAFSGKHVGTFDEAPLDRLLSREEVAAGIVRYSDGDGETERKRKLKAAAKRVDWLCRKGALRRVYSPHNPRRSCGISAASFRAFLAGEGVGE